MLTEATLAQIIYRVYLTHCGASFHHESPPPGTFPWTIARAVLAAMEKA